MNHHPLHTDAWYAEQATQFGKNVVVGNLVYSLVLGMSVPDVSGAAIANLEVETLQHKMPTFHGDTIYAVTTVLDKVESRSKPDRGVVAVVCGARGGGGPAGGAGGGAGAPCGHNNPPPPRGGPPPHVHPPPRHKKDGLRGFFWPREKYASEEEAAEFAARVRAAIDGAV